MPDDMLARYKSLTPTARLKELKTMLTEVFSRLEEHSGASADELVILAAGIQQHCERRRSARRTAQQAKPILTRYQIP